MPNKKIDELKRRANKRKMLMAQMEGLRKEGKHWDNYLKKNTRKQKATKAIGTAAEIAGYATGAGGVIKSGAKLAAKEIAKKANKVALNKGSKFAKRSTRATQAQTAKKAASKAKTTRGRASSKDILSGTSVNRKAVSKAAPKKSHMPQSMRKSTAKEKSSSPRYYPKDDGFRNVPANKESLKVAQNFGERFAKDTGTKPFSSEYKKAVERVLLDTNRGKSYKGATKAIRDKQPAQKHKAALEKGKRVRQERKLKEEASRVAKKKAAKKKKK